MNEKGKQRFENQIYMFRQRISVMRIQWNHRLHNKINYFAIKSNYVAVIFFCKKRKFHSILWSHKTLHIIRINCKFYWVYFHFFIFLDFIVGCPYPKFKAFPKICTFLWEFLNDIISLVSPTVHHSCQHNSRIFLVVSVISFLFF